MVVSAQRVADVVQQRHDDVGLVPPVAVGAGRGLERMFQPADGKAAVVPFQQPQMRQHPFRRVARMLAELARDQLPVFLRAFGHGGEFRPLCRAVKRIVVDVHAVLSRTLKMTTKPIRAAPGRQRGAKTHVTKPPAMG